VDEVGAGALEVDALAGGVGGEEDPDGVIGGGGVEGALDLFALVVADRAVELEEALVAAFGALEGAEEEAAQPALGVGVFGKNDELAGAPAAIGGRRGVAEVGGGALVLADPLEEGVDAAVGGGGVAAGEIEHGPQVGAGALRGRAEAGGGGGGALLLLGFEGFVGAIEVAVVELGGAVGWGEGGEGGEGVEAAGEVVVEAEGVGAEGAVEGGDRGEEALLEVGEDEALALVGGGDGELVVAQHTGEGELGGFAGGRQGPGGGEGEGGALVAGELRAGGVEGGLGGPGALVVAEGEGDDLTPREEAAGDPADVALEAADHHGAERVGALGDGGGAVEALGIEELQEGGEGVAVAVVRGGGEEEAVLEARTEVLAGDPGDLGVDRVGGARGGGDGVGLVEDEEGLAALAVLAVLAEEGAQGL
jgi:hypothetical protein